MNPAACGPWFYVCHVALFSSLDGTPTLPTFRNSVFTVALVAPLLLAGCSVDPAPTPPQPTPVNSSTSAASSAPSGVAEMPAEAFRDDNSDGYTVTFSDGTTCAAWIGNEGPLIDCPFKFPETTLVQAEIPPMATHPGNKAVANVIRYEAGEGFVPKALYTEWPIEPGRKLNPGEKVTLAGFTFEQISGSSFSGSRDGYSFTVTDGKFTSNDSEPVPNSSTGPDSNRAAEEFLLPGTSVKTYSVIFDEDQNNCFINLSSSEVYFSCGIPLDPPVIIHNEAIGKDVPADIVVFDNESRKFRLSQDLSGGTHYQPKSVLNPGESVTIADFEIRRETSGALSVESGDSSFTYVNGKTTFSP